MTILARYNEIISRELDIPKLIEADDPVEESNRFMRELANDLEKVKLELKETTEREKSADNLFNETKINIANINEKAIKAIQDGKYNDGKIFLNQKNNLEKTLNTLKGNHLIFQEHLQKLNDMYDLLTQQITILSSQKNDIKIKAAIKKAQQS